MSGDIRPLIDHTAEIVAAYVSHNNVGAADMPGLIASVRGALITTANGVVAAPERPAPAVAIKRSVTPDHIICLEDGLKFKSLKRHLSTKYDMSPDDCRARWGLPGDYPMVAPNHAQERAAIARRIGLGRRAAPASGRGRAKASAKSPAARSKVRARRRA